MSKREAYEQKMKARLKELKTEIERLKAKSESVSADAKLEYQKQLDEIKGKYDKANAKFMELQRSGSESWNEMKVGMEKAWEDMNTKVDSLVSKFKQQS